MVLARATYVTESEVAASRGSYRPGMKRVGSSEPWCLDVPHHAAESSSGLEQRAQALPASTPPLVLFLPPGHNCLI